MISTPPHYSEGGRISLGGRLFCITPTIPSGTASVLAVIHVTRSTGAAGLVRCTPAMSVSSVPSESYGLNGPCRHLRNFRGEPGGYTCQFRDNNTEHSSISNCPALDSVATWQATTASSTLYLAWASHMGLQRRLRGKSLPGPSPWASLRPNNCDHWSYISENLSH